VDRYEASDADGRLLRLEGQGLVERASRQPADVSRLPAPPQDPGGLVLQALLEERGEGRSLRRSVIDRAATRSRADP